MDVRWLVIVICVVIKFRGCVANGSFQDCFRKDSISCLQMQLFKRTRSISNNSTIDIFDGLVLIKAEGNEGKSLEQKVTEEKVEKAKDVESRQRALETYLMATVESLWKDRTFTWNPVQTAKALVNSIPDTVTSQLTSFALQARAKKKQLQMLIPILIALKMKIATIASIALMIIALIAKKAILAAVVSLVITGITGFKTLFGSSKPIHATEVVGYRAPSDWEPALLGGSYSDYSHGDLASSYSEPAPQHQLFIGHKVG